MIKIEEKLFQNRYRVDESKPHIRILDPEVCRSECGAKPCAVCCPASCYSKDAEGRVSLVTDGCLECGTCRVICGEGNLEWEFPRGGFGILFKFG